MKFFETITQYSSEYDDVWLNFPEAKKGLACPYFSVITAYKFMQTGTATKEIHEFCLRASINYSALIGTYNELTFGEILGLTNLNPNDILATTAELVAEGVLGFPEMISNELPKNKDRNAVIFLKNAKYFVVLADSKGYYLRDCHESVQYDFENYDELINHISTTYQFTETINVTGVTYSDYSSIEFLKVSKPFMTDILAIIGMDNATTNLHKLEIEGESGYICLDDAIPTFNDEGEDSIFDDMVVQQVMNETLKQNVTDPVENKIVYKSNNENQDFVDFE